MTNNNIIQKNRVYAPIIVGLSLLLIALVTYPLYEQYVDRSIQLRALEQTQSQKQDKVNAIKAMQARFSTASGSDALVKKVARYDHSFNTSDIMEVVMVNDFTKGTNLNPATIRIDGVNISKGTKLPSGLSLANVSINLAGVSIDDIVNYITYLTVDSKLAFTIDNINLPLDTAPSVVASNTGLVNMGVNLGVYYYE